jgi:hypothetical protein
VFVLAGAGTTLLLQQAVRRNTGRFFAIAAISALWTGSFAASYAFSLRDLQSNTYLNSFWESGFLRFPPVSAGDIRQYIVVGLGIFEVLFQNVQLEETLSERMSVIAAASWLIGVGILALRGRRGMTVLLVAPLAFAVLASLSHAYPLRFRLALFTAGPTLLAIAGGLSLLCRSREPAERVVGRAVLGCLLLLPTMQAAQFLAARPAPYGAATVLARIGQDWRTGDLVLVDGGSEPSFRWYQTYGRIPGLDRVAPTLSKRGLSDPSALIPSLPELSDRARVWIVISAHIPDRGGREAKFIKLTLDQWGQQIGSANANGYYARLYDFRAPSLVARRDRLRDDEVVRASREADRSVKELRQLGR